MGKILIVDDNRMILQALSDYLEEDGHDTEVASSGFDALELLAEFQPDLIIMDLVMPGMSGSEATRKIRENPKTASVPVVAFSSQANEGQWGDLFDDYLIKPFGYDQLSEIVTHFLGKGGSDLL